MKDRKFECQFCNSTFVFEDRFLRHRCKQMIREEEFRSPIGQQAWFFYQDWMKGNRRQLPRSNTFLHSKLYGAFDRFAKFAKSVNLPDSKVFIRLMIDRDIPPTMWNNDEVYAQYLEHLDRCGTPTKQAKTTINTLFSLADHHSCEVGDVFEHTLPNDVIQLIRQRCLSPWILLNSKKFMSFFVNRVSREEQIILEAIIRPAYWAKKFSSSKKDQDLMKTYITELNL